MAEQTTAKDLLLELKSFCKVTDSEIDKAEKSGVSDKNNTNFKILLNGWIKGKYDEDPFALVYEINTVVNKAKPKK